MSKSAVDRAIERILNGGNRRADKKGKGSATQEPDSSTGGSGAKGAAKGTVVTPLTGAPGAAYQGTSLGWLQYIGNNTIVWSANYHSRTPSGKWCPPWMSGELSKPNAALYWRPRAIPKKSSGMVAGEIIAWRAWYWTGKRLRSLFVDYEWPVDSPAKGETWNGYGIHAFKNPERVRHEYNGCLHELVVGQVALWGDVVEFEEGYTAEFAKVHCLIQGPKEVRDLYHTTKEDE